MVPPPFLLASCPRVAGRRLAPGPAACSQPNPIFHGAQCPTGRGMRLRLKDVKKDGDRSFQLSPFRVGPRLPVCTLRAGRKESMSAKCNPGRRDNFTML